MTRTDPILTVEGLRAYYQLGAFGIERDVRATDDISLEVRRGEIYGIAGESSSGKSTFIKVLVGAVRPPLNVLAGSAVYRFGDQAIDITKATPATLSAIRWKHLSYVMQGSMSVLNPVRRVSQTFADFASRHMGLDRKAFRAATEAHIERLGLSPRVLDSYPHELSGGMRQRVVIALATLCTPEFVIADEPTTALDVVVQKDVLALISGVQEELGSSFIFVTHDMAVHANIADRIGIIYAGRLVEEAPTRTLFKAPRHPYTTHLVGSLPRIGDQRPRPGLGGQPPNLADPPSGCRFHPRCPLAMDRCKVESPPLATIGEDHRVACFAVTDGGGRP
ncbi:ABC transporter ATP-binding protein [Consotaella aegiceratis]|uniref:ABC transporter ATP-binding protein n=1 Tax=Consotaella aegiceratis TaxID=3097961 RepID=UPI002F4100F4